MKLINLAIILSLSFALVACGGSSGNNNKKIASAPLTIEVPTQGNTWVEGSAKQSEKLISDKGVTGWTNEEDKLVTFVFLNKTGSLELGIKAKGVSLLAVSIGDQTTNVDVESSDYSVVPVGQFSIKEIGYHKIVIEGLAKQGEYFADISDVLLGGSATGEQTYFVKEDFYWGRRGPSVHLQYQLPQERDYEWLYSEITVPKGEDTLGTYYMANGFNGGYFGIQVNSEEERRVLFSIWSPYSTDDPTSIPEEYRIELLKKGQNVHTGKFGNEGSGGQSYLKYDWQAGNSYKFLTQIKPVEGTEKTDFTSYFFAPEVGEWQLIASFRRPKTTTYLTSPYSFLENFMPSTGHFERSANYHNQWVRTASNEWQEIIHAKFTYDATARKKSRFDYQGGVNSQGFYLKNTGFFSDYTLYDTPLTRGNGEQPVIDFSLLP